MSLKNHCVIKLHFFSENSSFNLSGNELNEIKETKGIIQTNENDEIIYSKSSLKEINKKIIVLVDDNNFINSATELVVQRALQEIKEIGNYEILKLNDGYDIIKFFLNDEDKRIKLIITDENMDFFNGSEAIKFIRNFEKLKILDPLLLASLSSNEDSQMKDYLVKCGANYCFNKPFTKSYCKELMKKIEEIKPKICVFGHIHEGYGYVFDGNTHYINASVLDGNYVYKNKPVSFEWDPVTNEINFI